MPKEEQVVTEETQTEWPCPKDGTAMVPMARGDGVRRCPKCRALFIDPEAMRRGGGRPPKWSPVVTSVLMSLLATFVVRRLRRRLSKQSPS
jgi:predicted RNA-binding Zn-ribbon protein involved in translation (DUF1610 family)